MLSIYTDTEQVAFLENLISREQGLDELVKVFASETVSAVKPALVIRNGVIAFPPDFSDLTPPYLLPEVDFDEDAFFAAVFVRLGNIERAVEFLPEGSRFFMHCMALGSLLSGSFLEAEILSFAADPHSYGLRGDAYSAVHNAAVLLHYNQGNAEDVLTYYERALELAPDENMRLFSSKHFAIYLLDQGRLVKAEAVLRAVKEKELSDIALHELRGALADVLLKKLSVPYDEFVLGELRSLLRDVLNYENRHGRKIKEGLRLMDASYAALVAKSYSEALGYLNKAAGIFDAENSVVFYGEAMRRKGMLLYTWAQSGNPQFFKSAMESFQSALEIFTEEEAPSVFADIHHHLGIVYTDLPVEENKKGLMAGLAVSSFQKALAFFRKETHPYEYAAVCTHFGNALCKFPPSLHSDNFAKALHYYSEALKIRGPQFPVERALTLLNYLEASWNVREKKNGFHEKRFRDMRDKALEILQLTEDETIRAEAQKHLDALAKLESLARK